MDEISRYIDTLNGWQRFFSAIGVIVFCAFCAFVFICIFGICLFIYEELVDRLNERKNIRRRR